MKNNYYLIFSSDDKVVDFYLQDILKKIKYNAADIVNIDLSENKFSDVLDEASINSMFSSVKIIIVSKFDIDKLNDNDNDYLERFVLNNKNKDVYIILLGEKVDTRKKNYKIFKDNFTVIGNSLKESINIHDYVNDYTYEHGYEISQDDITYLINKIGYDINNVNSELNKIFVYKDNNKLIKRDDIDLLVFDNIDNVMYEFTNAIMDNDYDKVTVMYERFKRDNVSIDYLISSLAGSIRTNLIIKLLKNNGKTNLEIANIINKKEYFVKKSLERLYRYSVEYLINYLSDLAIIDKNIKSGKCSDMELELFILNK